MNLTIEIENKEDFPYIKKLLENLKGVKILKKEIETVEDDTDEDINQEEAENIETSSEDLPGSESDEESIQDQTEQEKILENVAEVKEIVDKNPRITLWSSQSAAVFRYLRKTEPEFSISKEASVLIDEAVSKKYPEIWELFEDI